MFSLGLENKRDKRLSEGFLFHLFYMKLKWFHNLHVCCGKKSVWSRILFALNVIALGQCFLIRAFIGTICSGSLGPCVIILFFLLML